MWYIFSMIRKTVIGLIILATGSTDAFSAINLDMKYSDEEIVSAIYMAEGGSRAKWAYGIRSVQYKDKADAKRICLNTVRNNKKRYADYGHKQFRSFLEFLGSRYCPVVGHLSKAERRLNGHWVGNVRYYLEKSDGRAEKGRGK